MSGRNRYLLAPWMPIDVRLPALAGVVGMGTYLYLERNGRIDEAKEWADKVRTDAEANLQTARTSITSAWQSAQLDKWLPNRRGPSSATETPEVNEIKPDSPLEGVEPAPTTSQSVDVQHEGEPASDEPTTVTEKDVKRIDNLMQEALLGRNIPDPSDDESTSTVAEIASEKKLAHELEHQEPPGPLQVLQEIASQIDQAALATADALLPSPQHPEVAIRASHEDFEAGFPTQLQNRVLHTEGILGISSDVSAATLLANAQRFGLGSHGQARGAAAQQAVVDIETLHGALDKMGKHHTEAMAQAAAASAHWQRLSQLSERLAQEVAKGTQAVLQQQFADQEAAMKAASRSQAQQLAERFAEELTAERKERHQALSELGVSVARAREGLGRRAEELGRSDAAYVVTGAISAVRSAMAAGCKVDDVVQMLSRADKDDAVVHAARESLAGTSAPRVATVPELQARWPAVRRSVQTKAALRHDAHAGILSTLLAGAAARLKVSEWATVRVGGDRPGRSVDAQLAAIDECMAEGRLQDVAVLLDELQAVLHVDHVASAFSGAVKAKALADQALELLQAHACATGMHT